MVFWFAALVLTLAVAAIIAVPLIRAPDAAEGNPDVDIYRAQLAEIDRDLERNLLDPEEAERSRTEIARRLLAANKMTASPVTATKRHSVLAVLVLVVIAGVSFATYTQLGAPGYGDMPLQARLAASDEMRANRPSQAMLELAAPAPPPVELPQDYRDAIDRLREIAPTRPDDLEAWSLLMSHEFELNNFAGAAAAQEQVINILGDQARIDDYVRLLDLMIFATNGEVSREAETLLRQILARDDANIAARYHLGSLYYRTDRPDMAYRLWREIAEYGDPGSFHVRLARAEIEDAAFRAGINYTLPAVRGPSAADIANAQDLSSEDQQAMIGSMVAGLADRLANDGGTAADWARLIAAYGVLGAQDDARAIWVEARDVFGANPAAMEILTEAANDAGLLE